MEGREREGPQVTVEPGPLRALLRHWSAITRAGPIASPNFSDLLYMRARSTRNDNPIVHGDQTRHEEISTGSTKNTVCCC